MELTEAQCRSRFAAASVARVRTDQGSRTAIPVDFVLLGNVVAAVGDRGPMGLHGVHHVEFLVDRGDSVPGWWVRARGVGRVTEDGPEREPYLRQLAAKYPDLVGPRLGPLILAEIAGWTGWVDGSGPGVNPG